MSDPVISDRSTGAPVPLAVLIGTVVAIAAAFAAQFAIVSPFLQSQLSADVDMEDISIKLMAVGTMVALTTTVLGCAIARIVAGGRVSAGWITAAVLFLWSVGWSVFSFARIAIIWGEADVAMLLPFLTQIVLAAAVCGISGAIAMALPISNGPAE